MQHAQHPSFWLAPYCCCPVLLALYCCLPDAADASRMNALTGSPLTGDSDKGEGSGLVKQQGYILLVPQGTGDVTQGQVRARGGGGGSGQGGM